MKIDFGRGEQRPVAVIICADNDYQLTSIKPDLFSVVTSNASLSNGSHDEVIAKVPDMKRYKDKLIRIEYEHAPSKEGLCIVAAYFPRTSADTPVVTDKTSDDSAKDSGGDTGGSVGSSNSTEEPSVKRGRRPASRS